LQAGQRLLSSLYFYPCRVFQKRSQSMSLVRHSTTEYLVRGIRLNHTSRTIDLFSYFFYFAVYFFSVA
jgi:hypothetical protein